MKKIIFIIVAILMACSCAKNYRCELKYRVNYPDTSWVKTYIFDGNDAVYFTNKRSEYDDKQRLIIHPTGAKLPTSTICVVPNKNTEIEILDFKMYRYGFDIPQKNDLKETSIVE